MARVNKTSVMRFASFITCTSPRSGSMLLWSLLTETGVVGYPASLFDRPSLDDWMTRLGVEAGAGPERDLIREILLAAKRKGRGDTLVFGLRQQWPGFDFLFEKLAVASPDAKTDRRRIEAAFGLTLFIHLTRHDKLGQAISLIEARQTRLWHVAADGSERERTAPELPPTFDQAEISETVEALNSYDRGWAAWFERERIVPLRIAYSELSDDPVLTLGRTLAALGLDEAFAGQVQPQVRKMPDQLSGDRVARYIADGGRKRRPRRRPPPGSCCAMPW